MKPLKKILFILLPLILIIGLLCAVPFGVEAIDGVSYIDENGDTQTADNVTELTEELLTSSQPAYVLQSGWYAVKSDVEFGSRINAAGDVHIILCDGYTFTAHKGITVPKTSNVTRSLTIYAQSKDADEMGALVIDDVAENYPGIGGISTVYGGGTITVNGGKLTVTGGAKAAGIGGRDNAAGTDITINGGIINATGGTGSNDGGAGIGGGYYAGCDVTINGGTVKATGGAGAAGIGGGYLNADHSTVTINGGTVDAYGTSGGAGIGTGRIGSGFDYELDSDCIVKITGGTVTAHGGVTGAGIGGGYYSKGTVEITGGTVKAYKGTNASSSGIGNGAGTNGSKITLSWTDKEHDNYYADNYGGKVTLEKFFSDRADCIYTPGSVADNGDIDGKTIYACEPSVKKVWEVGSNRSLHPASVKMVLQVYKSPGGDQPKEWTTAHTVILNADNNWEADFGEYAETSTKSYKARIRELDAEDKPVCKQGDPEYVNDDDDDDKRPTVVYPVTSEGRSYKLNYRVSYKTDNSGQLTVTNKMDERTIKVEKKWDIDIENLDRPDSLQVMAQAKDGDSWKNIQIVTLSKDNDWKAELCVPKYRYEGSTKKEIEYRIRELKEESLYNQFMSGIKDLVIQGKQTYDEWKDKLKTEASNIYNALPEEIRNALDDSYESLCKTLGVADDKINELYDKLMDILERESAGIRVVHDKDDDDKGEKEETNAVVYNVPEYQSVVAAGKVDAHATKYRVTYKADDDDVTVTNLAIQEIDLYKHWIPLNVDDEDMPDSAWLVLMCKVKTEGAVENAQGLAQSAGVDFSDILDYEFPVINPLEGGHNPVSIISEMVLGVDIGTVIDKIAELFGVEDLVPKLAIMKVTEDDKWTAKVVDKKYTCGIQMEYRGAELTGEIIRQIIKYLTDGTIDLPISYNFFDNYITISTKAIPKLRWMSLDDLKEDLNWDSLIEKGKSISQEDLDNFKPQDLIFDKTALMTNIINVKFKLGDDDDDDDDTVSGTKTWVGDEEDKRPDWIKIHVKDGEDEIEGSPVTLNKSDFSGSTWDWSIDLDDDDKGKTFLVSEEFPSDYQYKDKYTCVRYGTNLVNTWHDTEPDKTTITGIKVWKDDNNAADIRPDSITVNLLADDEKVASVTVDKNCGWQFIFPERDVYKTVDNEKVKIVYTIQEEEVEGYEVSYSDYDIINSIPAEPDEPGKLTITATRTDSSVEQSYVYTVSGPDDIELTVAIVLEAGETSGSVTIAQLPAGDYTVTEESPWSWRYSDGGAKTATVAAEETATVTFAHTRANNNWLNGYSHRYTE